MGMPLSTGAENDPAAQVSLPAWGASRMLEQLAVLNRDDGARCAAAMAL